MGITIRKAAIESWKVSLRIIAITLALLLITLVLTITTEGGRLALAKQAVHVYDRTSDHTLTLKGLRSPRIGQWSATQLSYTAPNGLTLTASDFEFKWRWLYAIQNRWWIDDLNTQELSVTLPESQSASNNPLAELYDQWPLMPSIRVDRLHINQLTLSRARYRDFTGELDGVAQINWGALPARFLVSLSDTNSQSDFAAELSADGMDEVRLKGSLLAKANTAWSDWLRYSLSEDAEAAWDVLLNYATDNVVSLAINELSMPWQRHLLNASGQMDYAVNKAEMTFNSLLLALDDQPAVLDGTLAALDSNLSITVDSWPLAPFLSLAGLEQSEGSASLTAQWSGGWRQPRINGNLVAQGQWQGEPIKANITSEARRSALEITEGSMSLANNTAQMTGRVDWLNQALALDVSGTLQINEIIRAFLPAFLKDVTATAAVNANIRGDMTNPTVSVEAKASGTWKNSPIQAQMKGNWANNAFQAEGVSFQTDWGSAQGTAVLKPNPLQWTTDLSVERLHSDVLGFFGVQLPIDHNLTLTGPITLTNDNTGRFLLKGLAAAEGTWQNLPITGTLDIRSLTSRRIELNPSTLMIDNAKSDLEGGIFWAQKRVDMTLNHQDLPLSLLPAWFKKWPALLETFDGTATGNTRLYGPWTRPAIATDSQLNGQWFGEPLSLTLKTNPNTNTVWGIETLELQWLEATWNYSGQFRPYELGLSGDINLTDLSSDYIPLLSTSFTAKERRLPDTLNAQLNGDFSIEGTLSNPMLSGSANVQGFLESAALSVSVDINTLTPQQIDIEQANGQWAKGYWALSGDYRFADTTANIEVSTKTPDAAHLKPWLLLATRHQSTRDAINSWEGSLFGELQFDNRTDDWLIKGNLSSQGELLSQPYDVSWIGDGRLQQALQHELKANWGDSQYDLSLTSRNQQLEGALTLANIQLHQLQPFVPQVPEHIDGRIDGELFIAGSLSQPNLNGQFISQGVIGQGGEHPFNASVDMASNQGQWDIQQASFEIENAIDMVIQGNGQGLSGQLSMLGHLPETQYWLTNSEIGPGEAFFNLDINGDFKAPELNGDFSWLGTQWPITLNTDISTVQASYIINARLESDQMTRMAIGLKTPKSPLAEILDTPAQTPIKGTFFADIDLALLDPLFIDQPDQQIRGDMSADLQLNGTLNQPQLSGLVEFRNSVFEHTRLGTRLNDINLKLIGTDNQLNVTGSATDGSTGKVDLNGTITFANDTPPTAAHDIDLNVSLTSAQLLNQATLGATFSGDLYMTGAYHDIEITGALNVTPLTIQTESFLLDGVPQLNINTPTSTPSNTEAPTRYLPQGELNIRLFAENRANLYGQGINAELAGQVIVTDDLYEPTVQGQFNIVRGTYTGFGKVFQLSQGSVQVQNNQLVLDITGDYDRADLNVSVRISGTQEQLNLTLSSGTTADQDELLAQLLFGRVVEELDVFQAIQLASVINRLRTGDSGLDFVGATRENLELDALSVETETDEEGNLLLNVSAGKYINDFLYLEVEQGVGEEQEFRGSLQYQLLPKTYIELYTQGRFGEFDKNGIELNWSQDY